MRRPENHATRAAQAIRANTISARDDWPDISPRLVAFLEEMFPPRCMHPGEHPDKHMFYAGQVALVQLLRDKLDDIADFSAEAVASGDHGDEPYDEEAIAVEVAARSLNHNPI